MCKKMSGCGKLETDVHITSTAEQFHEIFCSRPHHIATLSSNKIKGVDILDGELGKVGSIIYVHDGKHCMAKEMVEAIDPEENLITFRIIEGDLLKDYKTFKATLQANPKDKGGVVHWTLEYEKKYGHITNPHTLL